MNWRDRIIPFEKIPLYAKQALHTAIMNPPPVFRGGFAGGEKGGEPGPVKVGIEGEVEFPQDNYIPANKKNRKKYYKERNENINRQLADWEEKKDPFNIKKRVISNTVEYYDENTGRTFNVYGDETTNGQNLIGKGLKFANADVFISPLQTPQERFFNQTFTPQEKIFPNAIQQPVTTFVASQESKQQQKAREDEYGWDKVIRQLKEHLEPWVKMSSLNPLVRGEGFIEGTELTPKSGIGDYIGAFGNKLIEATSLPFTIVSDLAQFNYEMGQTAEFAGQLMSLPSVIIPDEIKNGMISPVLLIPGLSEELEKSPELVKLRDNIVNLAVFALLDGAIKGGKIKNSTDAIKTIKELKPEDLAPYVEDIVKKPTEQTIVDEITNDPFENTAKKTVDEVKTAENQHTAITRDFAEKVWNEELLNNESQKIEINAPSEKAIKDVKQKTGLDISNKKRVIDNYSLRHIKKQHGSPATEEPRGQIAIEPKDIEKIPNITEYYDTVEYGGKNKHNLDVIKYNKRYNGTIYFFEEVRTGKGELVPDTMYKRKSGVKMNEPPDLTSETTANTNLHNSEKIVKDSEISKDRTSPNIDRTFITTGSELESSAYDYLQKNYDKLVENYEKENGNLVDPDRGKDMFVEAGYNGKNASDFRSPASQLVQNIYTKYLDERQGTGNNTVMFSMGGPGSGKTTAINEIFNTKEYPIVYDSPLAGYEYAKSKIQEALDKGYKVDINFVHRDPVNAYLEGVLKRNREGNPRVVPLEAHIDLHVNALETVKKLAEDFKDENVRIRVISNNGTIEEATLKDLNYLKNIKYFPEEIKKQIYESEQYKTSQEAQRNDSRRTSSLGERGSRTRGGVRGSVEERFKKRPGETEAKE